MQYWNGNPNQKIKLKKKERQRQRTTSAVGATRVARACASATSCSQKLTAALASVLNVKRHAA